MTNEELSEKPAYYRVDPYSKKEVIDWDENYDMLRGPNGFECLLTEPEDRNWFRDGKAVVAELNRLHSEVARLTECGPEAVIAKAGVLLPQPTERDWPEDRKHEDGNCLNECVYCGLMFVGYTSRVSCKRCFQETDSAALTEKENED